MLARWFFIISFCFSAFSYAQNNLIVLSENGEDFFLYINQTKINDSTQSEVKATKIYEDTCNVQVVFKNTQLKTFQATAYLLQNGRSCKNLDFTYSVENVSGKNKLVFISANTIDADTANPQPKPTTRINELFIATQKQNESSNKLAEKYPDPVLCTQIISDSALNKQISIFKNNHIEGNRIKDVKWFISANCLSVKQIQTIFASFEYENSKLKLSEFSFDYIFDKQNFLQFLNSLKHDTQKEELKTFYKNKTSK